MAHARHKDINTTRGYRRRAKVLVENPAKLLDPLTASRWREGQGALPPAPPPRAVALGTPSGSRVQGAVPPWRGPQGGSAPLVTVLALPITDWPQHRLTVSGPAAAVSDFQQAAAGAIPWTMTSTACKAGLTSATRAFE